MSVISRSKAILDGLSTVIVIVTSCALLWTLAHRTPSAVSPAVEPLAGLRIDSPAGTVLGTGATALVEFTDFQCPYCRRFAVEVWPVLKKELVDTNRVRYLAFHFPLERLHPLALGASTAAECAGEQGRFWEMRELLFDDPDGLEQSGLLARARQLNLELNAFAKCLDDQRTVDRVRANVEEGKRLGVTATPTFFTGIVESDGAIRLVGRIRGGADADFMSKQLTSIGPSRSWMFNWW